MISSPPQATLGVVLAGGANRRYHGRPKALASVGGERIVDRVVQALSQAADRVVLIANQPESYASLGLETRPDLRPGLGALGGIYTAVAWAEEQHCRGALVTACDMPFVPAPLLRLLVEEASPDEAVVPESDSRRGLEPLCAFYGIACRPAIEAALDAGDRQVISFYSSVRLRKIPRDRLTAFGDPSLLFLNVNTPEDRRRAEEAAGRQTDSAS